MIAWLAARWRAITRRDQYCPRERQILLQLAVLRAQVTATGALLLFAVERWEGWPAWLVAFMLGPNAVFFALLSADFLEHWLRKRLLGFDYNPRVSAIGEWEGWMGPTNTLASEGGPAMVQAWRDHMCEGPPKNAGLDHWGDPGGPKGFCQ